MKKIYVPLNRKISISENEIKNLGEKLPENMALFYSIQFKEVSKKIRDILQKDKKISLFQQVLGCSKPKINGDVEAIVLIGEGRFHALGLAIETGKKIFIYENEKFVSISEKEIEKYKQRKKGVYLRFLNSEKIGILVSTKPGQERFNRAIELKKKLEKQKKEVFIFITNNISVDEFDNFPDIDIWINTACPRMDMADERNRIINLKDVEEKF
jgi:2-(3-amino-3-carboxypropyl)histidine synthase